MEAQIPTRRMMIKAMMTSGRIHVELFERFVVSTIARIIYHT